LILTKAAQTVLERVEKGGDVMRFLFWYAVAADAALSAQNNEDQA